MSHLRTLEGGGKKSKHSEVRSSPTKSEDIPSEAVPWRNYRLIHSKEVGEVSFVFVQDQVLKTLVTNFSNQF